MGFQPAAESVGIVSFQENNVPRVHCPVSGFAVSFKQVRVEDAALVLYLLCHLGIVIIFALAAGYVFDALKVCRCFCPELFTDAESSRALYFFILCPEKVGCHFRRCFDAVLGHLCCHHKRIAANVANLSLEVAQHVYVAYRVPLLTERARYLVGYILLNLG